MRYRAVVDVDRGWAPLRQNGEHSDRWRGQCSEASATGPKCDVLCTQDGPARQIAGGEAEGKQPLRRRAFARAGSGKPPPMHHDDISTLHLQRCGGNDQGGSFSALATLTSAPASGRGRRRRLQARFVAYLALCGCQFIIEISDNLLTTRHFRNTLAIAWQSTVTAIGR
jgi:hypothetical protein